MMWSPFNTIKIITIIVLESLRNFVLAIRSQFCCATISDLTMPNCYPVNITWVEWSCWIRICPTSDRILFGLLRLSISILIVLVCVPRCSSSIPHDRISPRFLLLFDCRQMCPNHKLGLVRNQKLIFLVILAVNSK